IAPSVVSSAVMLVPSIPVYILLTSLIGSSYFANLVAFGCSGVLALVAYLIAMKKLGGISKEDVDSISPRISKILRLK
ncbi:MAG: hypothetical protein IKA99_08515, partial [Clostridia bacterium]|nr:hypothetical protein [Clostridia bacterium]